MNGTVTPQRCVVHYSLRGHSFSRSVLYPNRPLPLLTALLPPHTHPHTPELLWPCPCRLQRWPRVVLRLRQQDHVCERRGTPPLCARVHLHDQLQPRIRYGSRIQSPSHAHTHTHTLSLSLSLSLWQRRPLTACPLYIRTPFPCPPSFQSLLLTRFALQPLPSSRRALRRTPSAPWRGGASATAFRRTTTGSPASGPRTTRCRPRRGSRTASPRSSATSLTPSPPGPGKGSCSPPHPSPVSFIIHNPEPFHHSMFLSHTHTHTHTHTRSKVLAPARVRSLASNPRFEPSLRTLARLPRTPLVRRATPCPRTRSRSPPPPRYSFVGLRPPHSSPPSSGPASRCGTRPTRRRSPWATTRRSTWRTPRR